MDDNPSTLTNTTVGDGHGDKQEEIPSTSPTMVYGMLRYDRTHQQQRCNQFHMVTLNKINESKQFTQQQ